MTDKPDPDGYKVSTEDEITAPEFLSPISLKGTTLLENHVVKPLYLGYTVRKVETAFFELKCKECGETRTVKRTEELNKGDICRVRCSGCSFVEEDNKVTEHVIVGKLIRKEVFYEQ